MKNVLIITALLTTSSACLAGPRSETFHPTFSLDVYGVAANSSPFPDIVATQPCEDVCLAVRSCAIQIRDKAHRLLTWARFYGADMEIYCYPAFVDAFCLNLSGAVRTLQGSGLPGVIRQEMDVAVAGFASCQ